MKKLLLLLLAVVPAWAAGFFDDFDGDRLGAHWSIGSPKGAWYYSVHDSLLDVHGFGAYFPNQWIYARVGAFEDFDLRARVGWIQADSPGQSLCVWLLDQSREILTDMCYRLERLDGRPITTISASVAGGPRVEMPGPADGFHDFRISREANQFRAYFDGRNILQGSGTSADARYVSLFFRGTPLPAYTQLFVDYVGVVPEPSAAVLLAGGLGALALRRKRRHP